MTALPKDALDIIVAAIIVMAVGAAFQFLNAPTSYYLLFIMFFVMLIFFKVYWKKT